MEDELSAEAPVLGSARTEVLAAAMTGIVRDDQGRPLTGARVSWTTLEEGFFKLWTGWARQDWPAVGRASVETLTEGDGSFEFAGAPPGTEVAPSVVWITHARGEARMELVEPGAAPVRLSALELPAVPEMIVRVTDASGAPVAGALVEEFFNIPWDWRSDEFDPQAARVFRRSWTCDARGSVPIARLAGEVLLQARSGDLVSSPWAGPPRAEVVLTLGQSFDVSGTVTYVAGAEPEDDLSVLCLADLGGPTHVLSNVSVRPDGRWGSVTLPLGKATGFHFRLEGARIEVGHAYVDAPAAGESIVVDLEARRSTEQWYLVLDPDDNPLADASVTVSWERDGLETQSTRRARKEDSYLYFGDLPHGTVSYRAQAPGYMSGYFGTMVLPQEPPGTIGLVLLPGGQLTGQVLLAGAPLEDFEVTWWPTGARPDACTVGFRASEDGRFALDDVSLGSVSLYACSPECAPGEIVEVEVTEQRSPEVALETQVALRGRGRVVSAETGEPLPDAILQPIRTRQHLLVAPWGPPHRVDAGGSFDLTGFAAGQTRVRFSAPGYSSRTVETIADEGAIVEFGSVALSGRGPIRIELVWDGELDPGEYRFWADGAEPLGTRRFEQDGGLTYEDAHGGVYKMVIVGPDDFETRVTAICEPGEEWLFQIPVAGKRSLRVEVAVGPGSSVAEGVYVSAILPAISGRPATRLVPLGEDDAATFSGVLPGPYAIDVVLPDGGRWTRSGTIRETDLETVVQVRLGGEVQLLRVLDRYGDRVPKTWFNILDPETQAVVDGGITDDVGEHALGLQSGDYVALVSHPDLGHQFDLPLTVRGDRSEVLSVVLDARLHVEVELLDGGEPQAGLQCRLFDLSAASAVPGVTSGQDGRARWSKFAEGNYLIRVRHPDYWPTEAQASARADALSTPIQVRRLGDLELEARGATTGLVSGLILEVVSEEFGTSVATWLAGELVTASSPNLATGPGGVLKLTGLPHGSYTWRAQAPTGELVTGTAVVPAGGIGQARVLLP